MVGHPSINRAQGRVTTLIKTNVLPLNHATTIYIANNSHNYDVRQTKGSVHEQHNVGFPSFGKSH